MLKNSFSLRMSAVFPFLFLSLTALSAQYTPPPANVIVISDANKRTSAGGQLQDRITLIDGTVLVGKISEMSPSRVVIKVSGSDFVVDPARIKNVERNVDIDPMAGKQRDVAVVMKDGSRYRGTIAKADGTTTVVKTAGGEIPVRNDNIERIEYLDTEAVRQQDAVAARPSKWELSLKGGSMFTQLGTYSDILSPGFFGFLQAQYPEFRLPFDLRLAPGLQVGYVRNAAKSTASTKIDLFPGVISVTVSRQIASWPIDVFAGGLTGVSLTRVITATVPEKLSLDFSYGAEAGVKYYFNEHLTFRLGAIWLAVYESTATLNHLGAYASAGWLF